MKELGPIFKNTSAYENRAIDKHLRKMNFLTSFQKNFSIIYIWHSRCLKHISSPKNNLK